MNNIVYQRILYKTCNISLDNAPFLSTASLLTQTKPTLKPVEAVSGENVQIPHEITIQPYNINQRTRPENLILFCLYIPSEKLHASLNSKMKTSSFGLIHYHQQLST